MEKIINNTNREVISSFLHIIADKNLISDENLYSLEYLYWHLLRFRARLLSQKLRERGYSLSKFNYQTIPCIGLREVDLHECPCAPQSGCTFLKTKYAIPSFIKIQSVSSITGNINYDFLQWERFEDLRNSRFEAERIRPYYTIKNTGEGAFIYVYNDIHKDFITITAIFEDPINVYKFPSCDDKVDPCFDPMEKEFLLDSDLIPLMYDIAYQGLFRAQQQVQDIVNNSQDDVSPTQTPLK